MVPDVEQFVAPTQAKQLLQVKPVSALKRHARAHKAKYFTPRKKKTGAIGAQKESF